MPSEPRAAHEPASFAEGVGEGTDLTEFDDLLDSLRDAMRSAEEDRQRGRNRGGQEPTLLEKPAQAGSKPEKSAPQSAPHEATPAETHPTPAQAAAQDEDELGRGEGEGDGYPDWLTNGSALEAEGERAAARPDEPAGLDESARLDEPASPAELEWPGEPYVDLPGGWEQPSLTKRRHLYRSYESSRISAHAFRCRVTLSTNGHEYVGEAEGPSVPGVRAEIAAKATLDALCSAENGRVILSLMTARVLRFSDMPMVVVSVYGMNDEEVNRLVGVSVVENSEEQAAILATLQATDRWIAGVISRAHD